MQNAHHSHFHHNTDIPYSYSTLLPQYLVHFQTPETTVSPTTYYALCLVHFQSSFFLKCFLIKTLECAIGPINKKLIGHSNWCPIPKSYNHPPPPSQKPTRRSPCKPARLCYCLLPPVNSFPYSLRLVLVLSKILHIECFVIAFFPQSRIQNFSDAGLSFYSNLMPYPLSFYTKYHPDPYPFTPRFCHHPYPFTP